MRFFFFSIPTFPLASERNLHGIRGKDYFASSNIKAQCAFWTPFSGKKIYLGLSYDPQWGGKSAVAGMKANELQIKN